MYRPSASRPTNLITFFEGTSTDRGGRTLSEILSWPDEALEWSHDYIQTVFPLPEQSDYQGRVATVDEEVFKVFRLRKDLRDSLQAALKRMLSFYGFAFSVGKSGAPHVTQGPNYNRNPKVWNRRMDHNHLRITRIIRSLRILGLEHEALAVYNAISSRAQLASSSSQGFWKRAAFRSLNIPPDDVHTKDDNRTVGLRFLIHYEEEKAKEKLALIEDIKDGVALGEIADEKSGSGNVATDLIEKPVAGSGELSGKRPTKKLRKG